jgi:hypothetical protein
MKRPDADYEAIAAALKPHQLRTLEEYAEARGLAAERWQDLVVSATVAATLAVSNYVAGRGSGTPHNKALAAAAVDLGLDPDTVLRRWREAQFHRAATRPDGTGDRRATGGADQ